MKQELSKRHILNSSDLLFALEKLNINIDSFDDIFLSDDIFEIIIGAILVQQTKWKNVKNILEPLKQKKLTNIHNFVKLEEFELYTLISSCSFAKIKTKRLLMLAHNILNDFNSIDEFKKHATREWLLSQKGLGFESSDYILCYAFKRAVMVTDSYSARLLSSYGYEFEDYNELQSWLENGVYENFYKIKKLYKSEVDIDMSWLFARFHGLIVEFCKKHCKGKKIVDKILDL